MRILVTGFEPFGGEPINSSLEVVRNLPRSVGGARVSTAALPVVYRRSLAVLRRLVALEKPDAVLCLGLAGGRKALSFETRAVNLDDARIPDNNGHQPRGEEIRRGGPAELPPTLPLRRIARELRRASIPFEFSPSAGTFLCNHVFYGLVDYIHREDPSILGGFVHVPHIREHLAADLEELVRGIRAAIRALDS